MPSVNIYDSTDKLLPNEMSLTFDFSFFFDESYHPNYFSNSQNVQFFYFKKKKRSQSFIINKKFFTE